MKLNTWTHPKTGATRIYVNGASQTAKVWIENEGGSAIFHVRGSYGRLSQSQMDTLIGVVDIEYPNCSTFDDYLSVANS